MGGKVRLAGYSGGEGHMHDIHRRGCFVRVGVTDLEAVQEPSGCGYQRAGQHWAENLNHHAVRAEDFIFGAPIVREEWLQERGVPAVMVDSDEIRWVMASH